MPKKSGHLRHTNDENDGWQPPVVVREAREDTDSEEYLFSESDEDEAGEDDE